jgi:hypothetical protein
MAYIRRGMGQYEGSVEGITVDTSGVQIAAPTFVGPCPGGAVMNPQTGVCVMPSSPTPYVAPNAPAAPSALPSWLLPVGLGLLGLAMFMGAKR